MRDAPILEVEYVPIESVTPYEGNAKAHTDSQVEQIMRSIEEFGDCDPIGVWTGQDDVDYVVEGHGRLLALQRLGYEEIPVIYLNYLSDEQRRAYGLVHNQLTMNSGFDLESLAKELDKIADIDMDFYGFGNFQDFETDESDNVAADFEQIPKSTYVVCPCCGGKFDPNEKEE